MTTPRVIRTEVTLDKDCVKCDHFKHWMWEDAHPLLACSYGEKEK